MDSETRLIRLEMLNNLKKTYDDSLEEISKCFNSEIGRHEALDRSYVTSQNFTSNVLEHPYVIFRPSVFEIASKIDDLLFELYQEI